MLIVSAGIILAVSGASGPYWTKSYPLSAGLGAMHEIQVVNGAELVLHSPPGSNFDLYAMNNPGSFGTCPSNTYIMSHAGKTTTGMIFDSLILEPGLWCLVVYAEAGSGTYLLEASTLEAGSAGGWPGDSGGVEGVPGSGWWGPSGPGSDGGTLNGTWGTDHTGSGWVDPSGPGSDWGAFNGTWGTDHTGSGWVDPSGPGSDWGAFNGTWGTDSDPFHAAICVPYRSVTNNGVIDTWSDGFLFDREGAYARDGTFFPNTDTYSFQVQGYRSDIELIVIGPCGADIPNRMLSDSKITDLTRTPTFNSTCRASYVLLVSQDCNPNDPDCPVTAQVNSSANAYYRIENPSSGSTYFVSIAGIGHYTEDINYQLLVRSYQC